MSQYATDFKKAEKIIQETTQICKDKDAKISSLETQVKQMNHKFKNEIQTLEKLSK